MVVAHNDTKPPYAEAIATLVYKYIKDERNFKNRGTKILENNLYDSYVVSHAYNKNMERWNKNLPIHGEA
jgi:predicted DNA-binding protein (UPF0278 family)